MHSRCMAWWRRGIADLDVVLARHRIAGSGRWSASSPATGVFFSGATCAARSAGMRMSPGLAQYLVDARLPDVADVVIRIPSAARPPAEGSDLHVRMIHDGVLQEMPGGLVTCPIPSFRRYILARA